jgi:hypothetical protein
MALPLLRLTNTYQALVLMVAAEAVLIATAARPPSWRWPRWR